LQKKLAFARCVQRNAQVPTMGVAMMAAIRAIAGSALLLIQPITLLLLIPLCDMRSSRCAYGSDCADCGPRAVRHICKHVTCTTATHFHNVIRTHLKSNAPRGQLHHCATDKQGKCHCFCHSAAQEKLLQAEHRKELLAVLSKVMGIENGDRAPP
jgi:hypothetical protein